MAGEGVNAGAKISNASDSFTSATYTAGTSRYDGAKRDTVTGLGAVLFTAG